MRLPMVVGAALLGLLTNQARAEWTWNFQFLSQALFTSSGESTTKGAAAYYIPEYWDRSGTGLYANSFIILPLQNRWGREVDLRVGWRGQVAGLDVDASVANYTLWAGHTFDIFDSRLILSRRFAISSTVGITPTLEFDFEHCCRRGGDSLGVAPGIGLDLKLPNLYDATLRFNTEAWTYPIQGLAPHRGPVLAFRGSLLFPSELWGIKFNFGPTVAASYGALDDRRKKRSAFGFVIVAQF